MSKLNDYENRDIKDFLRGSFLEIVHLTEVASLVMDHATASVAKKCSFWFSSEPC